MSQGGGLDTLLAWLAHPRKRLALLGAAGGAGLLAGLLLYALFSGPKQTATVQPSAQPEPPAAPAPEPQAAPKTERKTATKTEPKPKPAPKVSQAKIEVTVRGALAQDVFEDLRFQGLRAVTMGISKVLLTPPKLRSTKVEGAALVQAIAEFEGLEVTWYRDGRAALLYPKPDHGEVARFQADMESGDPVRQARAAWRARWLKEPRVLKGLLKAAAGGDYEAARQARIALRDAGWEAAMLAHPDLALPLVKAELEHRHAAFQAAAVRALGVLDAETALPLLARLRARAYPDSVLSDAPENVPEALATVLGSWHDPQSFAMLSELVKNGGEQYRSGCARALIGNDSGEALELIKLLVKDEDRAASNAAAYALGRSAHPDKYPPLWEVLKSVPQQDSTKAQALLGLAQQGGEKALAILQHLRGQYGFPQEALNGIGRFGEEGLPLLEAELADKSFLGTRYADPNLQLPGRDRFCSALRALGHIAGEKARNILTEALYCENPTLRPAAIEGLLLAGEASALNRIDTCFAESNYTRLDSICVTFLSRGRRPEVFPLLAKAFATGQKIGERRLVQALVETGGAQALPHLEQALADKDDYVRYCAVTGLSEIGGEAMQEKLIGLLKSTEYRLPGSALSALGRTGDERALDAIEAQKDDPNRVMDASEVAAIAGIGGRRALAHIARYLQSDSKNVKEGSAYLLARAVPDLPPADMIQSQALARLALRSKNVYERNAACQVLALCGDESAIADLENVLANRDDHFCHMSAIEALAAIGTERAMKSVALELECRQFDARPFAKRVLGCSRTNAGK